MVTFPAGSAGAPPGIPFPFGGTTGPDVLNALRSFRDLVGAFDEIRRAQFPGTRVKGERGVESISRQAGELLANAGVVGSVDEGIVRFHEAITVDKPSLRKVLRKQDLRAGRLTRARPSPAQRTFRQLVKAGQVIRNRDGTLARLTPRGRILLRKIKVLEERKRTKAKIKKQKSILLRLTKGFAVGRK